MAVELTPDGTGVTPRPESGPARFGIRARAGSLAEHRGRQDRETSRLVRLTEV